MSEETHTEEHVEHAEHRIVSWKLYIINALVITVLMILTVVAAEFDFGHVNGLNLFIAVTIAVMKTVCIGAIFMGVWWNTPLVKVFALCAVAWLMIFFVFVMTDYINPTYGLGTPYVDFNHQGESPLPK
ncbi:MAG: hypothetical protein VCD00_13710 [Candidatus Hydrogenedentota bacterium]